MECLVCHKLFSCSSSLNRHIKKVHKVMGLITSTGVKSKFANKCLEGCDLSFRYTVDLIDHLKISHDIINECKNIQFTDMEEFKRWLEEIERKESCNFFKNTGVRRVEGHSKRVYYWCSRSGKDTQTTNARKRGFRIKGSKKTNCICTSHMVVTTNDAPKPGVNVAYWKEHYGHTKQIKYLPVPPSTSKAIANQLMIGVPTTRILKDIRDNITDDKIERSDLITMKDINNIKKKIGIDFKEGVRHKNDSTSVQRSGHLKGIHKRHFESLKMEANITAVENEENIWIINDAYMITKRLEESCCELLCGHCNICVHKYSCSCPDYQMKVTVCNHIHYFLRWKGEATPKISNQREEEEEKEAMDVLHGMNASNVSQKATVLDKLNNDLMVIMTNVQKIDVEKLHDFEKKVKSLRMLSGMLVEQSCENDHKIISSFSSKDTINEPANKKIAKQPSFFSTKTFLPNQNNM